MKTILALLHFLIAAWAIYTIYNSSANTLTKVVWSLAVFFFPVVGLIAWFFVGPK